MPRVECISVPGLRAWFITGDHIPWHFHLEKRGEWEVKMFFMRERNEMIEIVWGPGPRGKLKREITQAAEQNRDELLNEWESAQSA